MPLTEDYLSAINEAKTNGKSIDIDFRALPKGVDTITISKALHTNLPQEYVDNINLAAQNKKKVSLDYSQIGKIAPVGQEQVAQQGNPYAERFVQSWKDIYSGFKNVLGGATRGLVATVSPEAYKYISGIRTEPLKTEDYLGDILGKGTVGQPDYQSGFLEKIGNSAIFTELGISAVKAMPILKDFMTNAAKYRTVTIDIHKSPALFREVQDINNNVKKPSEEMTNFITNIEHGKVSYVIPRGQSVEQKIQELISATPETAFGGIPVNTIKKVMQYPLATTSQVAPIVSQEQQVIPAIVPQIATQAQIEPVAPIIPQTPQIAPMPEQAIPTPIIEAGQAQMPITPETIKPTAVFKGMQQGVPEKGIKPFALYNIVDPQNITGRANSTVAEETLKQLGIEVPKITQEIVSKTSEIIPKNIANIMDIKLGDMRNVSGGIGARIVEQIFKTHKDLPNVVKFNQFQSSIDTALRKKGYNTPKIQNMTLRDVKKVLTDKEIMDEFNDTLKRYDETKLQMKQTQKVVIPHTKPPMAKVVAPVPEEPIKTPIPKTPKELNLAKFRLRQLTNESKTLDNQIRQLTSQRDRFANRGLSTVALDKKLSDMNDKFMVKESEIADVITNNPELKKSEKLRVTVKEITQQNDTAIRKQVQAEARGIKSGIKEGKAITKEVLMDKFRQGTQRVNDVIEYIKQKLPVEEQGKFINVINNIKTSKKQFSVFARVEKAAEEITRKELISEVKTLSKPKGNINVDYQKELKFAIQDVDLKNPTSNTIIKLRNLKNYIQRNGVPLGINPKRIEQLNRLVKKPIATMTTEEISELKSVMENLRELGMLKLKLKNRYNQRIQKANMDRLLASTKNIDVKPSGNEKLDNAKKQAKQLYMDTLHTIRVADMIDGYKGYNGENAKNIKRLNTLENVSKINQAIDSTELLEKIRDVKPEWTEQEQRDVVLLLHNEQKQYDQVQSIIDEYGYDKLPEKTEEYSKIMDIIRDYFKRDYPKIQAIHEEKTNEILGEVDNYFPIKYEKEFNTLPQEAVNPQRYRKTQANKGFTFGRKQGVEKLPRTDLFGILDESINERQWYINMQPELDNIAELVKSKEFYNKSGEMVYKFWSDVLDVTARRGWSATAQQNFFLKQARLNLNQAILGYKISTVAMQPFAIFDALAYTSANHGLASFEIVKEFSKAWVKPNYSKALIEGSKALKLRKGGEMAIEESLSELKNENKAIKFIKNSALSGIQWADIKTAAGVREGILNILKKHNIPNAEEEADILMNLVSGSNDVTLRPLILSKGEGSRTWFTFQSFFLNRWGIIIHDLINSGLLKSKGISKKLWALIGFGVLVAGNIAEKKARNAMYSFISGKKPKPESNLKIALMTIPSQVPYFGNMLEMGLGGYEADPPLIKTVEDVFKGGGRVILGKKPETKIRGAMKLSESLLSLTLGVPGTAQAFDIMERVLSETSNEDSFGSQPRQAREARKPREARKARQ